MNAPMGQLDILPNTPKLWQSIVHPLVRAPLVKAIQLSPRLRHAMRAAVSTSQLSLAVLDRHLDHVLGSSWAQGSSAVRPLGNEQQVRSPMICCYIELKLYARSLPAHLIAGHTVIARFSQ